MTVIGDLSGRAFLVTGGAGGFGKASAHLLVRDGAAVVLMGRTHEKLQLARNSLRAACPGAAVVCHVGDASRKDDVAAAYRTVAELGSVGGAVLVVGGASGFGPVGAIDADAFVNDYRLNVGSALVGVQEGLVHMGNGGSIVCISSTAAKLTFPNLASYCAAKAGLEQFVRAAADELGPRGVRVNCVRPGLTRTDGLEAAFARPGYVEGFLPQIPLGRTGIPDEVAQAVRYLAGPESQWVTGQSFAVDGGNELRMAPRG
ncbi:SDR family NAD(P)-dependent oxidoreductase [Novosphingobium pentaromativorans]|uniref:7-alpha-hydroxysteroid dehydrogenase n=1 Tax=Novosphingobium pentaromativorans US6-1 TaxID=1088721 RepID=G6EAV6_9SPHN|nr:SDR family oxidoreductase [Novosphingobium pentaromativorans]EHJ61743.1 7-alpha-hydroxysteroid dehydrogenase [Novosphingobium pentaromativorans US6-1]